MQIRLFSTNELVRLNGLKEVTNPIIFDIGSIPTEDGLLSKTIFGNGSQERKETFAYIDLKGHFLHPFIYKLLKRVDVNISYLIDGSKKFKIENGKLTPTDDGTGDNGLEWLYKNWEKIEFKKNYSKVRNERVDVLYSYNKDTLFWTKVLVCPPFYRDVNMEASDTGKVKPHVLNKLYSTLITYAKNISSEGVFDFILNNSRANMQNTLVEIYDYAKVLLHKKNGMIRKSLLGKSIDYGARSVITAPVFKANKVSEMKINFSHTGIPLSLLCGLITPFMVHWCLRFFEREFEKLGGRVPIVDPKTKEIVRYAKLKNIDSYINEKFINKHLDRYIHSAADRFEEIKVPVEVSETETTYYYLRLQGRYAEPDKTETVSELINRHLTWTDLFYRAAVETCKGKVAWVTRYPLLDYYGTYPTFIHVLSTKETKPVYIGETLYPDYPVIDINYDKSKVSTLFMDTTAMSNVYLKGLCGDYDGDQITDKVVFSQNACEEGARIMKSKAFLLGMEGQNMRATTNEAIQTLYMLTKTEKE